MPRKELEDWILQLGMDLHRLSSEMTPAGPKVARQKGWAPRVDVLETQHAVVVRVELAGIKSGQFVIQVQEESRLLLVRGERHDEIADPQVPTASHQLEIEYGPFARDVKLPDVPLNLAEAQAQICNGMLTVVLPKAEEQTEHSVVVRRTTSVRRTR